MLIKQNSLKELPSSFRDPSGFLFLNDGIMYRQINLVYKENYEYLMNSGLYNALIADGLLIPHVETDIQTDNSKAAYKVIKPELIPFISYPYEWCFSQLKDAALTVLKIQKTAFNFNMSLKDSSAFNIQFRNGRPLLIDTLSFEKYREGRPWVAYRQFCQHFLAPLVLMSCKDVRLNQLSRIYIDGIPLDLASSLLPFKTCFKPSLFSHIYLHAKAQKHYEDKPIKLCDNKLSRLGLLALIDNLESAVRSIKLQPYGTEWANYYENTNYSSEAMQCKKKIVSEFLDCTNQKLVFDFGANTGFFSRIASSKNIQSISFDMDHSAVEENYLTCLKNKEINILPLLLDLTNPSPGIGWENKERMSLLERGPADMAFALALIHHLAICNNLPFERMAHFFSRVCNLLIIEFVPKSDSQVQRLLATRDDIFPDYSQQGFEDVFSKYFSIQKSVEIGNSGRILYLFQRKEQ